LKRLAEIETAVSSRMRQEPRFVQGVTATTRLAVLIPVKNLSPRDLVEIALTLFPWVSVHETTIVDGQARMVMEWPSTAGSFADAEQRVLAEAVAKKEEEKRRGSG